MSALKNVARYYRTPAFRFQICGRFEVSPPRRFRPSSRKAQTVLQVISALKGFAIEATDGRIGTVVDFLFDDASWKVRWLVVEMSRDPGSIDASAFTVRWLVDAIAKSPTAEERWARSVAGVPWK